MKQALIIFAVLLLVLLLISLFGGSVRTGVPSMASMASGFEGFAEAADKHAAPAPAPAPAPAAHVAAADDEHKQKAAAPAPAAAAAGHAAAGGAHGSGMMAEGFEDGESSMYAAAPAATLDAPNGADVPPADLIPSQAAQEDDEQDGGAASGVEPFSGASYANV